MRSLLPTHKSDLKGQVRFAELGRLLVAASGLCDPFSTGL